MNKPEARAIARKFLEGVEDAGVWAQLFDVLPDVYLFVKDRRHRFVRANRSELALHGCENETEILGRTDFDFHPPALAAQYVEEDRHVMESGRPLLNQVWLVRSAD